MLQLQNDHMKLIFYVSICLNGTIKWPASAYCLAYRYIHSLQQISVLTATYAEIVRKSIIYSWYNTCVTGVLKIHFLADFYSNPNQKHLYKLIKVFEITRKLQGCVFEQGWTELNSAACATSGHYPIRSQELGSHQTQKELWASVQG